MSAPDTPRALTGMHDLLPPASARRDAAVAVFADIASRSGFGRIDTPILEELAVFLRVGEGTDVVSKEMYTFEDRDGTIVALRPETTAGVARAFIEHHPLTPWRVWYLSQHFRHEKPQKGRLRQHHQLGVEVFGVADPDLDAEVIVMLCSVFDALGLTRYRVEVNDIGSAAERARYVEVLRNYARDRLGEIHEADRPKVDGNALRLLDSKRRETAAAMASAPLLFDFIADEAKVRFERVLDGLAAAGVDVVVNPRLVRGLDYYNGTVFEIVSEAIDAAQSTIGAGGRYDGLVEALGGPPTPGFGFGSGLERVLLACDAEQCFTPEPPTPEAFVVGFGGDGTDVRDLVDQLRRRGLAVERAYDGRSAKAQMKAADRSGAAWALLLGDDERANGTVTVRDLRADAPQRAVPAIDLDSLATLLRHTRKPDT